MKIIETKEWALTVDCKTCGSKLMIETGDVKYWSNQRTDGCGFYTNCPVCAGDIDLQSLPEIIKSKAIDRYRAAKN